MAAFEDAMAEERYEYAERALYMAGNQLDDRIVASKKILDIGDKEYRSINGILSDLKDDLVSFKSLLNQVRNKSHFKKELFYYV